MSTVCGTGTGNFPQPGDPNLNDSILTTSPAFGGIDVTWSYPGLNPQAVAHTLLYRSTNEDPATMVLHRTVTGDYFYDKTTTQTLIRYYYWIQIVSVNGTVGELIGPATSLARPTIDQMIEQLSGLINNGQLATSLKNELARIETNQVEILAEKTNRINADDSIGLAFNDLDIQVGGVDTLIRSEITERKAGDQSIIDNVNILFTQSNDNNALILQEQTVRSDADSALAGDIETLQAQTADNIAAVTTEQTARVDADSALGQRIDTVTASAVHVFRGGEAPDPGVTNINTNDLWVDTANGNRLYQWDSQAWVSAQDEDIAGAFTAVETETTARVNEDGLLAQDITTLEASIGRKSRTYFQTTAPPAENVGDLWIDTDNNNALFYWTGSAWVDGWDQRIAQTMQDVVDAQEAATSAMSAANTAQATADNKIRTYYQPGAPTGLNNTTDIGDLWFDTDDDQAHRWTGTAWKIIEDNSIATALAAAEGAQATADGKITTFYQSTTPEAEGTGDLWVDTGNQNKLKLWDGVFWANAQDGDIGSALQAASTAQSTADGKIESFWQSVAPTGKATGDLWFDTSDQNHPYRWSGATWEDARDDKIADAIDAAATAQSTADGKVQTFYQAGAPVAEGLGDLWIDTDNKNKLHRWNGTNWINAADTDKLRVFRQAAPPTAENVGDLWFDSDDSDKGYHWNGTSWAVLNLYTGNQVTTAIQDNNTSMIGYCFINGSTDSSYQDPDSCTTAGGEWLPATPLAEAVKGVEINDGGGSASVQQKMTSYKDNLDVLSAEYTVKVQVDPLDGSNKIIGGFGIAVNGETATVEAGFDVDRFWVGKLGNKTFPFIIEGSEVFMKEAVIQTLTFNKLRADNNSVVAANGKLKVDYLDVDNLVATQAESTNFVTGTAGSGWQLNKDGGAELRNATVHGRVEMDTGYIAEAVEIGGLGTFAYKDSLFYNEVTERPQKFRVISRGMSSTSHPAESGVYDEDGTNLVTPGRSYTVSVYDRVTRAFESHTTYDVYGNFGDRVAMRDQLNGLGSDKIVVVTTWDEPQGSRLAQGLEAAMYRCGASRTVFGNPVSFHTRSAYILVGIGGIGHGNGIEQFSGAFTDDPNAWCETSISIDRGDIALPGSGPQVSLLDTWEKPSTTLIDGNRIFTGDAYVDTLQIKGEAVTILSAVANGSSTYYGSSWGTAAVIEYNHGENYTLPVYVTWGGNLTGGQTCGNNCSNTTAEIRFLYRGAVQRHETQVGLGTKNMSYAYKFNMPPGNNQLLVQFKGGGGGTNCDAVNISAVGCKR